LAELARRFGRTPHPKRAEVKPCHRPHRLIHVMANTTRMVPHAVSRGAHIMGRLQGKAAIVTGGSVGIGAATDLASALAMDPSIADRCVFVWLGGHAPWSGEAREYNLEGDPEAARAIFRSPVPLVLAPAIGVTSQLLISPHALNAEIGESPGLGAWLADLVWNYHEDRFAWEKEMWDMGATGWCIDPTWIWTVMGGPWDIDSQLKWITPTQGKPVQTMFWVRRNDMFRDLFTKIRSL